MNNNTAMPTIEFGEGTDYDSLYTLLHLANEGLGKSHPGITWEFFLKDGSSIVGAFVTDRVTDEVDTTVISVQHDGIWVRKSVTVKTDDIVKVVYC